MFAKHINKRAIKIDIKKRTGCAQRHLNRMKNRNAKLCKIHIMVENMAECSGAVWCPLLFVLCVYGRCTTIGNSDQPYLNNKFSKRTHSKCSADSETCTTTHNEAEAPTSLKMQLLLFLCLVHFTCSHWKSAYIVHRYRCQAIVRSY